MAIGRIAIIGSRGHCSRVLAELEHMEALRVVGISDGGDSAAVAAQWCRDRGQEPEAHPDYRVMLDRTSPDVAVVCGPFELHAAMCIEAIERGIHVLTEKPAALTFEDLDRLREAVARRPAVHLAGMMFGRYTPGFYTAAKLIGQGALGEVRLIDARKSYKLGSREDHHRDRPTYGGTIPWMGSHAIDWIMWLSGGHFQSVYATHSTAHNGDNGEMESSAICHFTLSGGRAASVSVDVFRPAGAPTHGDDWARVVGTAGVMEIRPDSISMINGANDGSAAVPVACNTGLLKDFVDHVEGRRRALIDSRSTLDLTDACLRARQSADEGRLIEFSSFPRL
jgi:predicted dehydrogenase